MASADVASLVGDQELRVDPAELANIRAHVKRHLEGGGALEGLGIDPWEPAAGMAFAFVARTPKLPSAAAYNRALWRRCSYCETDRKFMDGSIVLCADHRLRLIGPDCWKDHIADHDWIAAKEEWQAFQRRERFEHLIERLKPAVIELRRELRIVAERHAVILRFTDAFPTTLASNMPALARELAKAARDGGDLMVERMVPMYGALEGAAGQRASQEREEKALGYRPQAVSIHRLAAPGALLRATASTVWLVDLARRHLAEALRRLEQTDWEQLSNISFKRAADTVEDDCAHASAHIDQLRTRIRSVRAFLGVANLAGIAKWANDTDCELGLDGTYEVIARGLRYTPERGEPAEVLMPERYGTPVLKSLDALKGLLALQ